MLSQKATQLSLNDNEQLATESTLQNETPPASTEVTPTDLLMPGGNIIDQFNAAAKALPTGGVLRDDTFSLFDAVGSLQIMDPKMDSGMLLRDQDWEDKYDVLQKLGPSQVIGIMDELLSFEMSWHQGFPLYRNLLSSQYIERLLHPQPADISEATFDRNAPDGGGNNGWLHVVLRAYCIATIKTCHLVAKRISSQIYHEEEDFNAQTHDRDLFSEFEIEPIQALLAEAIQFVSEDKTPGLEDDIRITIQVRLDLRQYMLYAVEEMDGEDSNIVMQSHWNECVRRIEHMNMDHMRGLCISGSYSQQLQFKIASSIPPKPLAQLSWNDTVQTFRNLARSAEDAYLIPEFVDFEHLLTYVQLLAAQNPQPPVYVRAVMQNLIWHDGLVLGKYGFKQALFNSIEETSLPISNIVDGRNDDIEAPADPRFKITRKMENFMRRAADVLLDMFIHQCMNRARLERDLSKEIRAWDGLEQEAEALDEDLRPYNDFHTLTPCPDGTSIKACPLKFWAARHKHRQMIWKVQMGFELDLYQPEELSTMYWLLAHFTTSYMDLLMNTQAFNLHRLRQVPAHQAHTAALINKVIERLENDIAETKAVYHLAASLSYLYAFLTHLGFIPSPFHAVAFTKAETRYAQRIKAYLSVADPECPSLSQIGQAISLDLDASHPSSSFSRPDGSHSEISASSKRSRNLALLSLAEEQVKVAKLGWAQWLKKTPSQGRYAGSDKRWKTDVQAVFKSAVSVGVVCASLKKILENLPHNKEFEFLLDYGMSNEIDVTIPDESERWHKAWIVPKVVPRAHRNGIA